ncbi:MAG: branched-chain amino acid transporter permease [Herbinix sp.]|nr:branched-chain amino acid transporter permease [Herbinix sp.]
MSNKKAALQAAIPYTLPVFTGYIVLGAAFGILMDSKGLSLFWTIFASLFVYAGSMQFVSVALLSAGFDPLYTFFITIAVNARHLFYGVSMLHRYKGTGKLKPYLIFSLTDESFSILCSSEPPVGIDRTLFMFYISLLNHIYWVLGSILGGVIGSMFTFNTTGIDFVLTALFVVILINQWKATTNHIPAIIGIVSAILCRILFGADDFIIPSMVLILFFVSILKAPMVARKGGE